MFLDIDQNEASTPLIIEETQSNTRLGRIGSLTSGRLDGVQSNSLLIGSIQGGVQAFSMQTGDTGIPPSTDWEVSTYPNPSAGRITVVSSQSAVGRLISLSGKLLLDGLEISESVDQSVDLSHLPQGLYLLQLISDMHSVQHLKIIIDE
jgi:hypothetical protein